MSQNYCGNDCTNCEKRNQKQCPGCRVGPGRKYGTQCDIAKCCISKNLSDCDGCENSESCIVRKGSKGAASTRAINQEKSEISLLTKHDYSALLSENLPVLFGLAIAALIVNTLCGLVELAFSLKYLSDISVIFFCILEAVVLIKLGKASSGFLVAGILGFVSLPFDVLELIFTHPALMVLFAVCNLALIITKEYLLFGGYIEVTEDLEPDLSQKWVKLRTAHFVLLCISGVCTVLAPLFAPAALIMLAAVIGYFVTSIIKLVFMYRTGKFFQEYY